jgi:hypothetical protein
LAPGRSDSSTQQRLVGIALVPDQANHFMGRRVVNENPITQIQPVLADQLLVVRSGSEQKELVSPPAAGHQRRAARVGRFTFAISIE